MNKIDNNENLTSEQLLMKSEGVKDVVKWIEEQIKKEKKLLVHDEKMDRDFGSYEDCGEGYRTQLAERKERINAMVDLKIGSEKYMRKLRHMAEEAEEKKSNV